jgi:hypothetical protein
MKAYRWTAEHRRSLAAAGAARPTAARVTIMVEEILLENMTSLLFAPPTAGVHRGDRISGESASV